jgi:outer membrane protein assembly factor BamB
MTNLRFAIVGTGFWARYQLSAWRDERRDNRRRQFETGAVDFCRVRIRAPRQRHSCGSKRRGFLLKRRVYFFAGVLLCAVAASAQHWPQFRGPNTQGHSTERNLPLKWSATENIAWKTALPGEAWSSPIVWGDHVFVTTATEAGTSCRVLALHRKTGAIRWNKEVFQQTTRRKEGRNTYATPTPATDGKLVYVCFGDGSFAALDFKGRVVWINREYPFYGQHGLGTALLLHDGLLLMARDGSSDGEDKKVGWQIPWDKSYVVALDAKTGQERWKAGRGLSRISHGTPAIWTTPDGRAQVVSEAGDVLQGFDLKTGARLWSSEVIGEGKVPSVVIGEGLAFTSGGWGGKESIKAFRLGGAGELKETNLVWEQKKGMPKVPSMIYVPPYLFALTDGGVATCMKAATGELLWQQRIGGNFSASPVAAEGRIYFVGDNGETTIIEASPTFKVLAKNPLDEPVQASPAIARGQLFIRTQQRLYCIGR